MQIKIEDFLFYIEISRHDLLILLKSEAKLINIQDIMKATSFLISDSQYVQGNYRTEYLKAYTSAFISRIKEVKEYESHDNENLDIEEVQKAIRLLLKQENEITGTDGFDPTFFQIYKIISLYTTFILKESVHPVGTPFPGGLKVKYDGKNYLCPVKERQENNPGAVCGICISKQDPETV
jgi:uncharacterized protein (UPF0305 family)